MKKQKKEKFDGVHYLLGIGRDGRKVWLLDFKPVINWGEVDWCGGEVEIFDDKKKNSLEYADFGRLFLNNYRFQESLDTLRMDEKTPNFYFTETTLTNREWFQLLRLFDYFYTLKRAVEILEDGMFYTSKGITGMGHKIAEEINEYIEKIIIPDIKKILEEEN